METKFTTGPWSHDGYSVENKDGSLICEVSEWKKCSGETEANARLIAAAPRMFKVIEAGAKAGDAECIAIVETVNGNT